MKKVWGYLPFIIPAALLVGSIIATTIASALIVQVNACDLQRPDTMVMEANLWDVWLHICSYIIPVPIDGFWDRTTALLPTKVLEASMSWFDWIIKYLTPGCIVRNANEHIINSSFFGEHPLALFSWLSHYLHIKL